MSVDDFMGGGFDRAMAADVDEEDLEEEELDEGDSDDVSGEEDEGDGEGDEEGSPSGGEEGMDEEDLTAHSKELENLKEKDPEFYKFLKQNDASLLDFAEPEEEDEEEEEEEEAGEGEENDISGDEIDDGMDDGGRAVREEAEEEEAAAATPKGKLLTTEMLQHWQQSILEQKSLGALRKLLMAFQSGCHITDANEETKPKEMFSIAHSGVFHELMQVCFSKMDSFFDRILGIKSTTNEGLPTKEKVVQNKKWKDLEPLVKRYMANLCHFMASITDDDMTIFVLEQTTRIGIYMVPFPGFAKKFVKILLQLWGRHEKQTVRVAAYHNIRRLAMVMPGDFMDLLMKGMYLTYARNSKFMNARSQRRIDFMALCIVEVYSLDPVQAYQHAFVYIRQLAVDLRQALVKVNKETFEKIYGWQYINCLRLWGRLITSPISDAKSLKALVYPLVQVIIGSITLLPTPSYFPLRLHGCSLLNEICRHTETYIPVAPLLLEVFSWSGLNKKPRASTAKAPDLTHRLKCSKSLLATRSCQDVLLSATVHLLAQHLNLFSRSVAFPELVVPTSLALKGLIKKTQIQRLNATAKRLVEKIAANSSFIAGHRSQLDCTPRDTEKIANFLADKPDTPLGLYVASLPKNSSLLGGGGGKGKGFESDSEEEEEEESEDEGDKKRRNKKKKRDQEEEDEEEGGVTQADIQDLNQEQDPGDEVGELDFSEDDEEEPAPKRKRGGKKHQHQKKK